MRYRYMVFDLVPPGDAEGRLDFFGAKGWRLLPETWRPLPSGYTSFVMERPSDD